MHNYFSKVVKDAYPNEVGFEVIMMIDGLPTISAIIPLKCISFSNGVADHERITFENQISTLSKENAYLKSVVEEKDEKINTLKEKFLTQMKKQQTELKRLFPSISLENSPLHATPEVEAVVEPGAAPLPAASVSNVNGCQEKGCSYVAPSHVRMR